MRTRTGLLAAVALALAMSGCGAKSDEDKVRDVIGDVAAARADGDAERACERDYAIVAEKPGEKPPPEAEAKEECVKALTAVLARAKRSVRSYREKVKAVEVEDDEARAVVRASGTRADGSSFARDITYELVRRGDGWRVAIGDE
jgi:ketosteroid isomerase-like protein